MMKPVGLSATVLQTCCTDRYFLLAGGSGGLGGASTGLVVGNGDTGGGRKNTGGGRAGVGSCCQSFTGTSSRLSSCSSGGGRDGGGGSGADGAGVGGMAGWTGQLEVGISLGAAGGAADTGAFSG